MTHVTQPSRVNCRAHSLHSSCIADGNGRVTRRSTGPFGTRFRRNSGRTCSVRRSRGARDIQAPYECGEILRHLYQFGLRSTPLIVTSGFAIGVVLSMHTRASLARFGAEAMIPAGLAIALIRETGPLTAGLLVSGRVGAGIGPEIGAMRVTEQRRA